MSWSSGWWGPALHSDQGDLRAMLDAFVAAHNPVLDDEPDAVAGLVTELAELGSGPSAQSNPRVGEVRHGT